MTRTFAIVVALSGAAACRPDPAPARAPTNTAEPSRTAMPTPPAPHPSDHRLTENSPSSLGGRQVVVFNIWARAYTRADGSPATGVAGVVSVSDGKIVKEATVGVGSRVDIAGAAYDVVAIDPGTPKTDQLGFIVLRPVAP